MKKIFSKKNTPIILAAASVVGLVGTVATAIRGTKKAEKILKEKEIDKGSPLTTVEKIKFAAPSYIPTIITGLATATCIVKETILNNKQFISLEASYGLVASQFTKYKSRVREIYGEKAHRDIMDQLDLAVGEPLPISADGIAISGFDIPDGAKKLLFYDTISEIYFESTYEEVLQALYHLNRNFVLRGDSPCDEYYEFLGIECSNMLGWNSWSGYCFIDFDISKVEKDGKVYFRIDPVFWPEPDYDKY